MTTAPTTTNTKPSTPSPALRNWASARFSAAVEAAYLREVATR